MPPSPSPRTSSRQGPSSDALAGVESLRPGLLMTGAAASTNDTCCSYLTSGLFFILNGDTNELDSNISSNPPKNFASSFDLNCQLVFIQELHF
ncbi:hypothetical protein FOCC_FOCC016592 [Frankliniella occidentalis]|nr:hypothetical protein FOCC_FOCC016592 [Frankliniella occidentalis]